MKTADELELQRAEAFQQVQKSERLRKIQVYGGMAGLFAVGITSATHGRSDGGNYG
jgi:hypothetical protein